MTSVLDAAIFTLRKENHIEGILCVYVDDFL